jgi:hypothetical protein
MHSGTPNTDSPTPRKVKQCLGVMLRSAFVQSGENLKGACLILQKSGRHRMARKIPMDGQKHLLLRVTRRWRSAERALLP